MKQLATYDNLGLQIEAGVARVVINRPDRRNAISPEVQADLRSALAVLHDDEDVGAVVLTGAGTRAFVAGADLGRLREYARDTALESRLQRLFDDVEAFEKPTIAAVNGVALGGGFELAMACDLRIAAESARFGLPETGLAILPGAGGTQRLTRLVGLGHAIDLILTGRVMTAAEALQIGLVTRVAPDAELLATADDVAATVLAKGPLAVRLAKLVVRTGMDADLRTGLVVERLAQALLYESDDKREGVEAFLARRTPHFDGR